MTITAKGKLNDRDIEAEVINPGDGFGKTWLVEIGGSAWPTFVAVEADKAALSKGDDPPRKAGVPYTD